MHATKEKDSLLCKNVLHMLFCRTGENIYLCVVSLGAGALLTGEETGLVSVWASFRRFARTSAILQGTLPEE